MLKLKNIFHLTTYRSWKNFEKLWSFEFSDRNKFSSPAVSSATIWLDGTSDWMVHDAYAVFSVPFDFWNHNVLIPIFAVTFITFALHNPIKRFLRKFWLMSAILIVHHAIDFVFHVYDKKEKHLKIASILSFFKKDIELKQNWNLPRKKLPHLTRAIGLYHKWIIMLIFPE